MFKLLDGDKDMYIEDDEERRASYLRAAVAATFEMGRALALQPAREFWEAADTTPLAERATQLALRLGAAKMEVVLDNEPLRDVRIDPYPASVLTEIFHSLSTFFHAVSRAQIYFDAASAIGRLEVSQEEAAERLNLAAVVTDEAWDYVEIAYLRAAAYWDRIGQLLDFVFFNVRQYREGFSETMKKLKSNFDVTDLPVRRLRDSVDWILLRQFETREHDLLTSKRNILAHRVSPGHFRAGGSEEPRSKLRGIQSKQLQLQRLLV